MWGNEAGAELAQISAASVIYPKYATAQSETAGLRDGPNERHQIPKASTD